MKRALRWLGLLVAGGVLATAALAWRLARGPIDAAVLVPRLERALAGREGGRTASIGGVEVYWDRHHGEVGLRARRVRVVGPTGETIATFPSVAVELDLDQLWRGAVIPRTIEIVGPRLVIRRTPDGEMRLRVGQERGETGDDTFLRRFARAELWPALRRIEVREGEIEVADRPPEHPARLHAVEAALERDGDGLALTLAGLADIGVATLPLHAEGRYRFDGAPAEARVHFDDLDPATLADDLPPAAATLARQLGVRLQGTVTLALDDAFRPRRITLAAGGGAGRYLVPGVPGDAIPIAQLSVTATLELPSRALAVGELTVRLPRGSVRASGHVTTLGEAGEFSADATAADVPVDTLQAYWPTAVAAGVRGWVTSRVTTGIVREARLHLQGRTGGAGEGAVASASGTLGFDGIGVCYLDGLPAARAVAGTAKFSPDAWRFHVERGAVGLLDVTRGTFDVTGPGGRRRGTLDLSLRGPVAEGLAVARAVPNGPAIPATIPTDVKGTLDARLRMELPLAGATVPRNVRLSADLRDVSAPAVFRGAALGEGQFALALAAGALDLSGQGKLDGMPVTVAWRERLQGGKVRTAARTPPRGRIRLLVRRSGSTCVPGSTGRST